MSRSSRPTRRGSGLLEVVIATFMVMAALSVFSALFPPATGTIKLTKWRGAAVRSCATEIEQIRASSYSVVNARIPGDAAEYEAAFSPTGDLPQGRGVLRYRRVLFNGNRLDTWTPGGRRADGIEVTATAFWKNAGKMYAEGRSSVCTVVVARPQRLLEQILELLT
jgi:hypothetical protein